jgi:hypothetical protein
MKVFAFFVIPYLFLLLPFRFLPNTNNYTPPARLPARL